MNMPISQQVRPIVLYLIQHLNQKLTLDQLTSTFQQATKELDNACSILHSPEYSGIQYSVLVRSEPKGHLIGDLIAGGSSLGADENRTQVLHQFQQKYTESLRKALKDYKLHPTTLSIDISVVGFR
ncbi:MAG: hypothetical protein HY363_06245 [Candidatus Aenigmarchaeota archaeon]|nr:hypothetical protein [Candidatus Aenigmarchaeota archaeon]